MHACICTNIHIYIYICTYIYSCNFWFSAWIYVYIAVSFSGLIYQYINAHGCIYVYIYIYIYACACVSPSICIFSMCSRPGVHPCIHNLQNLQGFYDSRKRARRGNLILIPDTWDLYRWQIQAENMWVVGELQKMEEVDNYKDQFTRLHVFITDPGIMDQISRSCEAITAMVDWPEYEPTWVPLVDEGVLRCKLTNDATICMQPNTNDEKLEKYNQAQHPGMIVGKMVRLRLKFSFVNRWWVGPDTQKAKINARTDFMEVLGFQSKL